MNKTAIKNFAIWARVQLIESAKQRAYEYAITEEGQNDPNLDVVNGCILSGEEKEQRRQLIRQIRQKGYAQVMEEAAYTWFNRFIALRYMEVNGYLPSRIRVFSDENGAFKPDILKEALTVDLDGLDRKKVLGYLDNQDNEALYKYLLITQCNALNSGLPYMFEKISNWTELLFPTNLLRQDSVLGQMVSEIPEEDWTDAVQIIGWMYQYYNSELKDETFALLSKNVKITKERIPAATQLFTPDWIIRYMVENSLGRLWYEGHKDFDKSQWKYYLDEAEQEPEVEKQLAEIRAEYSKLRPEEIKVIDPCCGSGHILVYAFDILMQIYLSAGWSERDAAKSILENNLYGLDIDNRAGQLANFAVIMRARKYSRRILNSEVKPNVLSIQESNWMTDVFIDYVAGKDSQIKADLVVLRNMFKDAKEYGSILKVPTLHYETLYERIEIISKSYTENLFEGQYQTWTTELLLPLVKQAQVMSQKYDVVVTNPPYMGSAGMGANLSEFVKKNYPDSKSDLFAVFIERCGQIIKLSGYQAMITQHAWMFLSSYEKLRVKLLQKDIVNMVHLGARAFEEIGGEVVQTTSFVIRKNNTKRYKGTYCRLIQPTSQQGKEEMFLSGQSRYYAQEDNFEKIPGSPVAYWVTNKVLMTFSYPSVETGGSFSYGVFTCNNQLFLRLWFETPANKIDFIGNNPTLPWKKLNKGGTGRKWYGNQEYIINYGDDGKRIKLYRKENGQSESLPGEMFYFLPHISWSLVTMGGLTFRFYPKGMIFDISAPSMFNTNIETMLVVLGVLNSKIGGFYLPLFNPTMNNTNSDIKRIPLLLKDVEIPLISKVVSKCIEISKLDWDSYETSWDFKKHPLV